MVEKSAKDRLCNIGIDILQLFKRLRAVWSRPSVEDGEIEQWSQAFQAEADRFELWAVNLGLFVAGHGSLDYRLRQADSLRQTVQTFLQSLCDALTERRFL